jgi:hypothetical protein
MNSDRDAVAKLLGDDPERSYRSISRELGISDWLVRKIARELDGDSRPMRRSRSQCFNQSDNEAPAAAGWIVLAVVGGCLVLMIWAGARWTPPPET